MKKALIITGAVAAVIAAFAVFFAFQATPGDVLNSVRADGLEIVDGVVTVPEKYRVIDTDAFSGKGEFSKVVVEGEADIRAEAFSGCPSLETVELKKTCDISAKAFANCPLLKTVTIHSADGTCAADAFEGHGGVTIYCREGSEALEVAKLNDMNFKILDD